MKTRNRIIIFLALAGIALTIFVQGYIVPLNNQKKLQYSIDQQSPVTHDLNSILKYRNKYMGNISNLSNLFYNLPQGSSGITFQLYPDTLAADINYKVTSQAINLQDKYHTLRVVLYNSTAAFALIDNLKVLNYNFKDFSIRVTREEIEEWYGTDIHNLLKVEAWKSRVQSRLMDESYIKGFSDLILLQNAK